MNLVGVDHDRAQRGGLPIFAPLHGLSGLSSLGCDLRRRDAPIVVKIKRGIGRLAGARENPSASSRSSGASARLVEWMTTKLSAVPRDPLTDAIEIIEKLLALCTRHDLKREAYSIALGEELPQPAKRKPGRPQKNSSLLPLARAFTSASNPRASGKAR